MFQDLLDKVLNSGVESMPGWEQVFNYLEKNPDLKKHPFLVKVVSRIKEERNKNPRTDIEWAAFLSGMMTVFVVLDKGDKLEDMIEKM